jgi:hypothetical protein
MVSISITVEESEQLWSGFRACTIRALSAPMKLPLAAAGGSF